MTLVLPKSLLVWLLAMATVGSAPASFAQGLPATNFGKFVHQPGDNQYEDKAQHERHSPPPVARSVPASFAGGGAGAPVQSRPAWAPTPPPRLPDTSIQPIIADEPIKPPGFPPLPERLDLPVSSAWARAAGPGPSNSAGPNQQSGGSTGGSGFNRNLQGVHEHYQHYMPGACIKDTATSSQGQAAPQSGGNNGSSRGYYKCTTPDYYSANTGGGAPRQREPGLNSKLDTVQRPDAPTPVTVSQSTTQEISSQDLSLPDDDYNAQSPSTRNSRGKQLGRGIQRTATRTMYRVGSQMIYGGGSMLRMH